MEDKYLHVKMLGQFSISCGGSCIDDSRDRSRKVWMLLAYLIYNRDRSISSDELIELLHSRENSNPAGALKTSLHRVRAVLDGLYDSAGHELIIHKNGGYRWSEKHPVRTDVEEFERLCHEAGAEKDPEKKLQLWLEAEKLFGGDFLKKLSDGIWIVPISAYYHRLYMNLVSGLLPLLQERGRHEDCVAIAEKTTMLEPSGEEAYRYLMESLLQLGRQKEAARAYEELRALLLNDFGVMPSDETRSIYRKVLRIINSNALQLDAIKLQLTEERGTSGAMICEYDFFRVLYQAEARAITRNGYAVHIALLSVLNRDGEDLAQRSLDKTMQNLQEQIRTNLRKGDVASRCSVSQYIIMLPQANYENSCMVCRRIISAFSRKYPHSPARIEFAVEALEPNT